MVMIFYKGVAYSDNQIFAVASQIAEAAQVAFSDVVNAMNSIMLSEANDLKAIESIIKITKQVEIFQDISITKNDIFMIKKMSKQRRRGKNKGVF